MGLPKESPIFYTMTAWSAGVLVYFLALGIQLAVAIFEQRGQHVPYTANSTLASIVLTDSLTTDIQQMLDVTSVSQFAVETDRGQFMLLVLSSTASSTLLCVSWLSIREDTRLYAWNAIGYGAILFVGLFGTALPTQPSADGSGDTVGPRRTYQAYFLWTIDDTSGQAVHVAGATLFLFWPIVVTVAWLWARRRRALGETKHAGLPAGAHAIPTGELTLWLVIYAGLLVVNLAFAATQIVAVVNDALSQTVAGVWIVLEIIAFGSTFAVYASFELWHFEKRTRLVPAGTKSRRHNRRLRRKLAWMDAQ